jgi:hypothetical protein
MFFLEQWRILQFPDLVWQILYWQVSVYVLLLRSRQTISTVCVQRTQEKDRVWATSDILFLSPQRQEGDNWKNVRIGRTSMERAFIYGWSTRWESHRRVAFG